MVQWFVRNSATYGHMKPFQSQNAKKCYSYTRDLTGSVLSLSIIIENLALIVIFNV